MVRMDDRLERLITRRLDGELTEAEELELNKLLIRSPEARRLLEDYQRQDALVTAALRETLSGAPSMVPLADGPCGASQPKRMPWLRPLAVAASIGLVAGLGAYFAADLWSRAGAADGHASPPHVIIAANPPAVTPVDSGAGGHEPVYRRQAVDRDILGVLGDDGKTLYLMEINRTQTASEPVGADL